LQVRKLQSLFLLFARQFDFGRLLLVEFVFPLGFQRASHQAVFRLYVAKAPFGSLRFIASIWPETPYFGSGARR